MLPRSNHGYPVRPRKPASRRRPTTRSDVTTTLPAEVVLEIIEYVKEDHAFSSLYAYSLVSHDWLRAMRSTLFTKMTITFNELSQFTCLLASPRCSLNYYVRELCIRHIPVWDLMGFTFGDKSFKDYAGMISNITRLLPDVTRLSLLKVDFPSLRCQLFHETYAGFDQIETLVLRDGVCEATPFTLEEVLSSFPRVRRLECDRLHLLDAKTHSFSCCLALQHPSAQYLPELTELSIMRPYIDLVTLITHCVSLRYIKWLNYGWRSDRLRLKEEAEAVFNMLRLIGPTLEHLSFTGRMDGSMDWQNGGWDFKHNTSLHTLSLQIDTPGQSCKLGRLMDTMIISQPLRTLIFNIFSDDPYTAIRKLLLDGHRLTQALEYRDDVFGGLEMLICNVRIREFYESREEISVSLRHMLDPGRRRWWERGILSIIIS